MSSEGCLTIFSTADRSFSSLINSLFTRGPCSVTVPSSCGFVTSTFGFHATWLSTHSKLLIKDQRIWRSISEKWGSWLIFWEYCYLGLLILLSYFLYVLPHLTYWSHSTDIFRHTYCYLLIECRYHIFLTFCCWRKYTIKVLFHSLPTLLVGNRLLIVNTLFSVYCKNVDIYWHCKWIVNLSNLSKMWIHRHWL